MNQTASEACTSPRPRASDTVSTCGRGSSRPRLRKMLLDHRPDDRVRAAAGSAASAARLGAGRREQRMPGRAPPPPPPRSRAARRRARPSRPAPPAARPRDRGCPRGAATAGSRFGPVRGAQARARHRARRRRAPPPAAPASPPSAARPTASTPPSAAGRRAPGPRGRARSATGRRASGTAARPSVSRSRRPARSKSAVPEPLLELAQGLRHRRLRDRQRLGRLPDAREPRHLEEAAHMAVADRGSFIHCPVMNSSARYHFT